MDDLRKRIQKLSGDRAKSLLFNIMSCIEIMKESKDSQPEMMEKLFFLHDRIKGVLNNEKQGEREYKTVQIVCGESPAGSLKVGLGRENKVIGFPDFFAVGPIWELHKKTGCKFRYEWLSDHLNYYRDDYMEEEYERRFSQALNDIETVPAHVPFVIWTAENANEQIGMRYFLYILKEKPNDIFLINSTTAYQELLKSSHKHAEHLHTGEVSPEQLNFIFQTKLTQPLTIEQRKQFEKEWIDLSKTKETVRIWINNKIKAVKEDYFDEHIVSTAKKIHSKQKQRDFVKAGRIIGEVYGSIEHNVGDAFLEYRLRTLIYNGVFEIKGIPKGMQYYSVKLRC